MQRFTWTGGSAAASSPPRTLRAVLAEDWSLRAVTWAGWTSKRFAGPSAMVPSLRIAARATFALKNARDVIAAGTSCHVWRYPDGTMSEISLGEPAGPVISPVQKADEDNLLSRQTGNIGRLEP